MEFSHYTDRTAMLAAEVANLFADGRSAVRVADAQRLLRAYGVPTGRLTVADVDELADLADRLRDVFGQGDAGGAGELLNGLLERAQVRPHVSGHDGRDPHLHFAVEGSPVPRRVAANTAMSLAVVLCDYGIERLGACAADGCAQVFIDTSRNAQRRFCSEGCSNRSNVAAHRARLVRRAPA